MRGRARIIKFICEPAVGAGLQNNQEREGFAMRLKDTGLTPKELKDIVGKYMVETYERYDFIAERAEGMYIYDEEGNAYLDFYGGVAVHSPGNRNERVVEAV